MLSVVADDAAQAELRLDLDELFREGARRMLAVALEVEVDAYIAAYAELADECGHRLVRPQRPRPSPHDRRRCRPGRGGASPGGRPARGPGDRAAPAVPEHDPAPLVSGAARRSPRCCRCCTCMGCPAPTSSRH